MNNPLRLTISVPDMLRCCLFVYIVISGSALYASEEDEVAVGVTVEWKISQHPAISHRYMTGYSEAIYTMNIAPLVSGRINGINIDVGDICNADSIITLEPTMPRIDLMLAQEKLTQGQTSVKHSIATRDIAKAEHEFQVTEHHRIIEHKKRGIVSAKDFAASRMSLTRALLALQRQEIAVEQAQQNVKISELHILKSQDALDKHSLKAPIGWTVSKRHLQNGSFVAAGQAIISLSDIRTLVVHLSLDEDELSALRNMKTIPLLFTQQGKVIEAIIKSVSPDFIAHSRKRDVTLVFPASDLGKHATGGLSCTLDIPIADPEHISIPLVYIQKRFGQNRVLDTDNIWHPIIISRTNDSYAVISQHQLPAHIILQVPANVVDSE